MGVIARVTGTALVPGVSKNGRLYTPDLIEKAVTRARQRIASPDGMPITTRTHHAAEDDSTKLVGRLTALRLAPDGSAKFEAVLTDTDEGRAIASLAEDHDGKPVLKGVSIRGAWIGKVRQVVAEDGQKATTADDLELDGLDYTASPGVVGAGIDRIEMVSAGRPAESSGRVLIYESVQEALVTAAIDEASAPAPADTKKPYGDVPYADPGYQKDGKKRYPVDTKAHAKSAWSYVGQADNARLYTAAQLKRVKGRIKAALGKFGVTVAAREGWLIDPIGKVTEAVGEYYGIDYATRPGSFSINIDNGMVCVSVSSYSIDPHDLDVIARAAMTGACQALAVMDPDMDGDIDLPGDTDAGESAPGAAVTETEAFPPAPADGPEPSRQEAGDTTSTEEAVVPDATTIPAVESAAATPAQPAGITLTDDQFALLLGRLAQPTAPAAAVVPAVVPTPVAAPAETAPAAAVVTETEDQRVARLVDAAVQAQLAKANPPPVVETEEQRINRLVEARVTQAVQESVTKNGPPARKGLTAPVNETSQPSPGATEGLNSNGLPSDWPDKPLHQYTAEERLRHLSPTLLQHVVGDRIR